MLVRQLWLGQIGSGKFRKDPVWQFWSGASGHGPFWYRTVCEVRRDKAVKAVHGLVGLGWVGCVWPVLVGFGSYGMGWMVE